MSTVTGSSTSSASRVDRPRSACIAYALTAGGTLELRAPGEQLSVLAVDEVLLKWQGKATGDHVLVEVGLSSIA